MTIEELIGKMTKSNDFNLAINGITFSGTCVDGKVEIKKINVEPEQVKEIVLAHIAGLGVNTDKLTYHEFKVKCQDYESYEFNGIVYEKQTIGAKK